MKDYKDILQEIEEAMQEKSNTADKALTAFVKAKRGTDFITYKKEVEPFRAAAAAEAERNRNINIYIDCLYNNYLNALKVQVLPLLCDVWNSYSGKRYGEKTAAKIREEMQKIFSRSYVSTYKYDRYFCIDDVKYCTSKLILVDNVIQLVCVDDFFVYGLRNYIEDIPQYIKQVKQAYEDGKKAAEAYEEARKKYVELKLPKFAELPSIIGVNKHIR